MLMLIKSSQNVICEKSIVVVCGLFSRSKEKEYL